MTCHLSSYVAVATTHRDNTRRKRCFEWTKTASMGRNGIVLSNSVNRKCYLDTGCKGQFKNRNENYFMIYKLTI